MKSVQFLSTMQSALDPAGRQAVQIKNDFDLFLYVSASIYILVLVFLFWAIYRKTAIGGSETVMIPDIEKDRKKVTSVSIAAISTVFILFALLIADFSASARLYSLEDRQPLNIQITGHQWWWDVKYLDSVPANIVTTANEVHIPIGKEVMFHLQSTDVIHSFWAPNFHGKKDLIPGHPTTAFFQANQAGLFGGQCAEFCGHEHALMRFDVITEPADRFYRWLNEQRKPAPVPMSVPQQHGQQVFLNATCVMCHTIQGTTAAATVGPNLTHFASRRMIGAGAIPNHDPELAHWIQNAQEIKPGVKMPPNALAANDLEDLVVYLRSLR